MAENKYQLTLGHVNFKEDGTVSDGQINFKNRNTDGNACVIIKNGKFHNLTHDLKEQLLAALNEEEKSPEETLAGLLGT